MRSNSGRLHATLTAVFVLLLSGIVLLAVSLAALALEFRVQRWA